MEKPDSKWRIRWLRLPQVRTLCIFSFITSLPFLLWPFFDVEYSSTIFVARAIADIDNADANPYVAVSEFFGISPWSFFTDWDRYGIRLCLLAALTYFAATAWLLLFIKALRVRTRQAFLVVAAIPMFWIGLWCSYPPLCKLSAIVHARELIPELEPIAQSLAENWPSSSGVLRDGTRFSVSSTDPNSLNITRTESHSRRAGIGWSITRIGKTRLQFTFSNNAVILPGHRCNFLEWDSSAASPESFLDAQNDNYTLENIYRFEGTRWTLAYYRRSR